MEKSYILFIDSGIGGLSTLSETIKLLKANYIYFADTEFAPYGNKSDSFLQNRLTEIILHIQSKYHISMVVLACNTATTTSIKYLRQIFSNLEIIGTEPAIKPAYNKGFQHISLIATSQTINHINTQNRPDLTLYPSSNLATLIEKSLLSPTIFNTLKLNEELYTITNLTKTSDCIVLGCTHYPFIKNKFQTLTNKPILDGNQGVARRIKQLCKENNQKSSIKIEITSENSKELQKYRKILNQILAKQIKL